MPSRRTIDDMTSRDRHAQEPNASTNPERASLQPGRLHAHILRSLISSGQAPTVAELAREWQSTPDEVRISLRDLQEEHGVVLHPRSDEVWLIHPFSTAPTAFTVHSGERVWWANCAWCSLGAAALIGGDCRITTSLGAHGDRVDLELRGGELLPTELLIHLPVPMARAWDNVLYTCSTMLFFERELDIEAWCRRHGIAMGDVRRVRDFWPFAREWYANHLSESWRKVQVDEARALFERHGLDGPIWALGTGRERF